MGMLKIEEVRAGYGAEDVVKGVSLEPRQGELFCIVGPNGCGKSTLLKTLSRLLPYRGRITLDGRELSTFNRRALAQKMALLAQASQVSFPYTVYDTVAMGRYAYTRGFLKTLDPHDQEVVNQALQTLGLQDDRHRMIDELSGGQVQRVFLARTLAQTPEVILLDEPTNHLDIKYQIDFLRYLQRWAAESGNTVVAVLHDLNFAHQFAGRVALMRDGAIVCCGSPKEALDSDLLQDVYGVDIQGFMQESLAKWAE
jgi:iron complex transport system ATP-binding protein